LEIFHIVIFGLALAHLSFATVEDRSLTQVDQPS